jgi:hypothetical protein
VIKDESQSGQSPRDDATRSGKASLGKAIVEWFWRGARLADRRRVLPELHGRGAAFAQRARASAEVARSALTQEPLDTLLDANVAELSRQSAYWSLCALAELSGRAVGTDYAESIWAELDPSMLADAAERTERIEGLRSSLRAGSFVYFAELPRDEQLASCVELRKLSEALLVKLDERSRTLNRILFQRAWRLGLLVLGALFVATATVWVRGALLERSDLAAGKPWRASSQFASICISPAQQCPESAGYFFHTAEEQDPWIEFDLGTSRLLSRVRVDNRQDCCAERAIPLTVEVSANHQTWQTVAREDAEFKSFSTSFTPVQARWLRLRVLNRTFLHLERVRIF